MTRSADPVRYEFEVEGRSRLSIEVPSPPFVFRYDPSFSGESDYGVAWGNKVAILLNVAYDKRRGLPDSSISLALYEIGEAETLRGFAERKLKWWESIGKTGELSAQVVRGREWIVLDRHDNGSVSFYSSLNGHVISVSLNLSYIFSRDEIAARRLIFDAVIASLRCSGVCALK